MKIGRRPFALLFLFAANAAVASTLTWTGASPTSSRWSDPANWTPAAVPADGDALAAAVWTGAVDQYWSHAGNWSAGTVPAAGQNIVFPAGAPLTTTNDLPGPTSVGSLTFQDAYVVGGNDLAVHGGISAVQAHITANVVVAGAQTFTAATFDGAVDVNGQTLTAYGSTFNGPLTGSGTITSTSLTAAISLNAPSNTFSGLIENQHVALSGSAPAATLGNAGGYLSGLTVAGEQTIGDITIDDALRLNGGVLHTGALALSGRGASAASPQDATFFVNVDGASSDRIDVHGAVSISTASLAINVAAPPATGSVFTIISNDGTDAVSGHFLNLNEGDALTVSGVKFRISYVGGDGNDVTLTVIDPNGAPSTVTVNGSGQSVAGQLAVFNISVQPPPASGIAYFSIDGDTSHFDVNHASIVNGLATFSTAALAVGTHSIVAIYDGNGSIAGSTSAPFTHVVTVPVDDLAVTAPDVRTVEGNSGSTLVTVTVALSAPSADSVSIDYHTENDTATAGEDYGQVAGTLTIPAGATFGSIPLTIFGDAKPELDEALFVVLDRTSAGIIATPRVRVTIVNDDPMFTRSGPLVYSTAGSSPLTLEILSPLGQRGAVPAVVAFVSPDDEAVVERETLRGYAVVLVSTRSTFPASLDDARAALGWLRDRGTAYGINGERLAAWGIGRGGNTAALLGTASTASVPPGRLSAVVDWYGETDYVALAQPGRVCPTDYSAVFGCDPAMCVDVASNASPMRYASAGDSPFLIVHGSSDCIVPLSQSTALLDALVRNGVAANLVTVEGGHGGSAFLDAGVLAVVDAFLDKYIGMTPPTRFRAVRH